MGLNTKIEYLRKGGSTHNFWLGGCEKISEGCRNCFAEKMFKRFYGKDFSKPILSKNFDAPLKWKKPRVILVNDMSDFFHKEKSMLSITAIQDVMIKTPRHIYLLLTKRAKNIKWIMDFYSDNFLKKMSKNIWLGVSVENQQTADERIPELLKIPHFKKWLSVEPMLEEINISRYLINKKHSCLIDTQIDWVVCGAETGKGVRPMKTEWAKYLLDQCKCSSVPFFMKQMSNKAPIPKDLMVREYPKEMEQK